ncbi:DDN1 protein, partial [Chloroceryle aenea]|nr:DDN1 protein [Chloroceryle aenea]
QKMLLLLGLTSAFLLLPWAGAGRIIGGWEAKPHSRPYMAFILIKHAKGASRCGGFLIRPDSVLSAAHCVAGKTKVKITVTLGAHNIKKKEQSQQVLHVDDWAIHSNYSRTPLQNDIILLKLNQKASLTKEVGEASLASQNEPVAIGATCYVAGWGRTSVSGHTSSVLREVDLKVQSASVCKKSFGRHYLQQSMICVGDQSGKKSTFRGDSGGPLVCNGKVHGIASYVPQNGLFPDVFTKVSYFEPWIDEQLKK